MVDLKTVQSYYNQATADWANSRWSPNYPLVTLGNYKRVAKYIPDLIEEVESLRARVKELESNGN